MVPLSDSPRARRATTLLAFLAALGLMACDTGGGDPVAMFTSALPLESTLALTQPGEDEPESDDPDDERPPSVPLSEIPSDLQVQSITKAKVINAYLKMIRVRMANLIKNARAHHHDATRALWLAGKKGEKQHILLVERHVDGRFSYQILVREAGDGPLEWSLVIAGTWTPGAGGDDGAGALWIDLEQDKKPNTEGIVLAIWSRDQGHTSITAHLYEAVGDDPATTGEAQTAVYRFEREAAGGGTFAFRDELEVKVPSVGGSQPKSVDGYFVTRWLPGGAGRSDVTVPGQGGSFLGQSVLLRSECWAAKNTGFALDYEAAWLEKPNDDEPQPLAEPASGDPEACVFPERGKVILPPMGEAPATPEPFAWFLEAAEKHVAGLEAAAAFAGE